MSLLHKWEALGLWGTKLSRQRDSILELKLKGDLPRLNKVQKREIKAYWHGKRVDYRYFSLYNRTGKIDPRYIPDDLYYTTVDPYFNDAIKCRYVDDKNLYDLIFADVLQPKTIGRRENGIFLSDSYDLVTEDYLIQACISAESVVIKKSNNANGGKDIFFWKYNGVDSSVRLLREFFDKNKYSFIVQECVKQHPIIAKLHPSSVNTIRMLTLNWRGKVVVLSSIIRMGANGSDVDNGHSGGIFCGIDKNGRLKDCAFTYMTGERFEKKHPTTGAVFTDCVIPNYEACKELVINLAPRLSGFSRLTSWDLSINGGGKPLLIEVNLAYGGLFFHQIANGPVFGNMTEKIIKEVIIKE